MKKQILIIMFGLLMSISMISQAQLVSKNSHQNSNQQQITGSRKPEIEAFHQKTEQIQNAFLNKNSDKVEQLRSELIALSEKELKHTIQNLNDIKSGKLATDPNTGKPFNQKLEIQVLSNRLNRERYLVNRFKTAEIPNSANPRDFAMIRSNFYEFEKLMKANLKYEKKDTAPKKSSGNTASLKNIPQGGGELVSQSGHPSKSPKTSKSSGKSMPPSYYARMEENQIKSLNRLRENRNKQAESIINELNAFVKKGNFAKASALIPEAASIVHSDIRGNKKFLERARNFKSVKVDTEKINNTIKRELNIENTLETLKISNMDELKNNLDKIIGLLRDFQRLTVPLK